MSLHFHWSKQWYELFTSCNVFCMQAWDFRKFQIRAIISSKHTQQRIWKKLAHCRVLFVAVRMVTRHMLDVQPSVLNCECSSETAPTCDGFQPFLLALYLLWDNFLISEMTTIHVNNTTKKTPCQAQSVHSLGMLIAENQHFLSGVISGFGRGVNEICAILRFYAASVGSFLPTFRDNGGGEFFTAVLVKIQVIWDVWPCRLSVYPHLQGRQSKTKALLC